MISRSPSDLQPVFDEIARSATVLAGVGLLFLRRATRALFAQAR